MFKKNYIIIGSILLAMFAVFAGSGFVASAFESPEKAAAEAARKAWEAHEEARIKKCSYLGDLTYKCYNQNKDACTTLHEVEEDFLANYEVSAYQDCDPMYDVPVDNTTEEEAAPNTPIPLHVDDSSNPLFFGDEQN